MKSDDYIRSRLPLEELLAGLAEEAAELAQAALKYRRAITGINPTPKLAAEALGGLLEEVADVNLDLLLPSDGGSILKLYEIQREKRKPWVQRLKEVEA